MSQINATQPDKPKQRGIPLGRNVSEGLAGQQDVSLKTVAKNFLNNNKAEIERMCPNGFTLSWVSGLKEKVLKRELLQVYGNDPDIVWHLENEKIKGMMPDGGVFF